MSEVRNWLKTLWPASYKGVPFYFEKDDERGGRGLVIHEFPNRDDPFVEDLGEQPRFYGGHAYVHGDAADGLARALIAVCTMRGPGPLVVPLFGPVVVQCQHFERKHEKDKLGYVAFELRFVRDGALTGLISIAALANAVFGAADGMAGALSSVFAAGLTVFDQPDFVVGAAVDGVAGAAAALDTIRSSSSVDPGVSATVRDQAAAIIGAASSAIVDDAVPGDDVAALAASLVLATRTLADGMGADAAAAAMLDLADISAPPPLPTYITPSWLTAAQNAAAAARLARLAALTAFAEALTRRVYSSRSDGVSARAQAAVRFDAELNACHGAADATLYLAIQTLRASIVDYLTQLITTLQPVVTVITARSLPSLVIAWRLYADPLRSTELVGRNLVRHPSFMPLEFEALAA